MATVGGNLLQRPRCWYFRAGYGLLGHEGRQEPGPRGRQPLPRHLPDRRRRPVRQPVEPGRPPDRPGGHGDDPRPQGGADRPRRGPLPGPQGEGRPRADAPPRRAADQGHHPRRQGEERLVRGPAEAGARLAAGPRVGQPDDGRRQGPDGRASSSAGSPRSPGGARRPRRRSPARRSRWRPPPPRARPPSRGPSRSR